MGIIKRPLIDIEIFSPIGNKWFIIENVLVDTGADLSVLPYSQGSMFIENIESGMRTDVSGIVPYARLVVYLHNLKMRVGGHELEAPVLIAESDDVPPILGRVKAIDQFLAEFDKGEELRLK
ncbi:MAG: hypothetical protein JSW00_04355 [Thermoplasmata archaeon]|nr:MAG: hypothetical protein JSW00_04355 [Thermoplasmata archaeon]